MSQLARALEKRVRRGDYMLQPFPTDEAVACEAQVSRLTARKAVQMLIDKGLLLREPNSRVTVNRENARPQVALLLPAYPSPIYERWHRAIETAVAKRGWDVRVIGYSHAEDHVIHAAISEFDGVFFLPPVAEPPVSLIEQFQQPGHRVVMLDSDLSAQGLPSLLLTPPRLAIQRILGHLAGLGHRRIAFLNTQPHDQIIELRLQGWQVWAERHPGAAELFDEPVEAYGSAADKAYRVVGRALANGTLESAAIICSSASAALGASRAIFDRGLIVGRALSLCSLDDAAGEAMLYRPSITCVRSPDPAAYLDRCLEWMGSVGGEWSGSLLIQPEQVELFEGESTGEN
ncbi:MAG: substrate-binding domain-containing protein [Verrucomicrobiota bacterium]